MVIAPTKNLVVGGRTFTDLTNLIVLSASDAAAGGNTFSTLRAAGATSGYAVTALKTLTIEVYGGNAEGGIPSPVIGYGDTDVGQGSAAAPTNPVYLSGTNNKHTYVNSAASSPVYLNVRFPVPAGKYPFVKVFGASSFGMIAYGYET